MSSEPIEIEGWIEQAGGEIRQSLYDPHAGGMGFARLGNLLLRYDGGEVHVAWQPHFDRWANSVKWVFPLPTTIEHFQYMKNEATRRGDEACLIPVRVDYPR